MNLKIKKKFFLQLSSLFIISSGIIWIYTSNSTINTLIINEIGSNNSNTLADSDGDFSDWIEILNPTQETISTQGFQLSVADQVWELPKIDLDKNEYLLVWASAKDRAFNSQDLHTNFKIDKEGELITLTSTLDKVVIDKVAVPQLSSDVSYGRNPLSMKNFCFFAFPSPLFENSNQCFKDSSLGAPKFSHDSGLYEDSFELKIQPQVKNQKIFYTLDGSYPDIENNSSSTKIYEKPLKLGPSNKTFLSSRLFGSANDEYPFRRPSLINESATIVRARTEYGSENSGFYLFSAFSETSVPVVSLIMNKDYLTDRYSGIYTNSFNSKTNQANFFNRGREWERPFASNTKDAVIFKYCSESQCLSQNIGLRVHGGAGRRYPAKSLRLYAREEYGANNFRNTFFSNQKVTSYKRLILRNSGMDWGVTMLADGTFHSIVQNLRVDTQDFQPVVVFLNGEYWGLHNLRERYDRFYFAEKYGLKKEEITMLDSFLNVEEGSKAAHFEYKNFISNIAKFDYGDNRALELINENIHVPNFIDYMVVQTFFAPFDWPTNNNKFWRVDPNSVSQNGELSKWRWVINDLDYSGHISIDHEVGASSYDYFVDRIESTEFSVRNGFDYDPLKDGGVSLIFTHIISNPNTRKIFFERYLEILDSEFSSNFMVNQLDKNRVKIRSEMPRHIARWAYPRSLEV